MLESNMLIVDANSIASISFYTTNRLNVINYILSAFDVIGGQEVVFAFDADGKYFRHDLYPEYKGKRNWDDETERNGFINEVKQALIDTRHTVLQVANYEADDIIATIVKDNSNSYILSKDRDLWQLIDAHTQVIVPGENKTTTMETVYDKLGVYPTSLLDYKIMVGDSGDNIPGVYRIGPKKALELLGNYGTIGNIVANLHYQSLSIQQHFADADIDLLTKLLKLDNQVPLPEWLPTKFDVKGMVDILKEN